MRYYFLIAGSLCILYYLILVIYSRRLRSTFAAFWLVSGGVHLLAGCMPLSAYVYTICAWVYAALCILFLSVEFKILRAMAAEPEHGADWIIVLGAQVRGTYITNSLKRRLDAAFFYLKHSPQTKVIVSGGRGPGEDISEAEAMSGYLMKHGVPKEKIFLENRSTSTRENLRFSRKYADAEKDRVGIVTNDFHIYRSSLIARQEGYENIIMIPAGSNPVFQINYLVREFFAVVRTWMSG